MNIIKLRALVPLFSLLFGCSACTSIINKHDPLPDSQAITVAQDFVAALALLRGHSPRNTTVQVTPAKTAFGHALIAELRHTGYGIQTVPENDTGPMLVTYEADAYENANYQSVAYRLRVGGVEMGREYELRGGQVFPMTSLSVKGVSIASQRLDKSIFERNPDIDTSVVQDQALVHRSPSNPALRAGLIEPTRASEDESWISVQPRRSTNVPSQGMNEQIDRSPSSAKETVNMLMLGHSNHASVFKHYKNRHEGVLVFADDSLRLGVNAKNQTRHMLIDFNRDTDIVSIVGCSHGPTAYDGGNKQLALDRSSRVREELVVLGVPENKIYDEGCWAGYKQRALPARGVILSVKRRS